MLGARHSLLINYPLSVTTKGRIGNMGGPTGGSQELVGGGFFPFFESVPASVIRYVYHVLHWRMAAIILCPQGTNDRYGGDYVFH